MVKFPILHNSSLTLEFALVPSRRLISLQFRSPDLIPLHLVHVLIGSSLSESALVFLQSSAPVDSFLKGLWSGPPSPPWHSLS